MNVELLVAVIVIIIGLGLSLFAIKTAYRPYESREAQLERDVKQLRAALDLLTTDRLKDREKIEQLEAKLVTANDRIKELEIRLAQYEGSTKRNDKHLLVGIGKDAQLQIDLASLRAVKTKTGMGFTRIMPVTKERLHLTLANARTSGRPIRLLHLSVHAEPEFIALDEKVDAVWLSGELQDVQILVLAGCETSAVGTWLGVVPNVVTMLEAVRMDDAARFSEVFWTNIGLGKNSEDAFYDALDKVPAVSEFAELHN